jgi:hypothetical protein
LLIFFFDPEDEDDMFLRNVSLTFNGQHGLIFQKLNSSELYCLIYLFNDRHYSSATIATDYGQDDRGSIPNRARVFFLYSTASRPAL